MTATATPTAPRATREAPAPPTEVRFVHLAPRRVFAVDGMGQPGGDEFQAALAALYPVAYALHFALRRRGLDARIGALEGLWWTPDDLHFGAVQPHPGDIGAWPWTLLIGVPVEATDAEIDAAIDAARRKRPSPALQHLRVATLDEGECAEVLHIGPYSAEEPTIERLHAAVRASGRVPHGRHHELYLGDPRRSAPQRLRTLIRQPVEAARG